MNVAKNKDYAEYNKESKAWRINYNGYVYETISSFCDVYNVVESTAQKQLSEGMLPSGIVASAAYKQKQRTTVGLEEYNPERHKVKYEEYGFKSLSDASRKLDVPIHIIYIMKRRYPTLSDEGVINKAKEHDEQTKVDNRSTVSQRSSKPCIVQGVRYESRGEACKAYGIPIQTVSSRMQRAKKNDDMAFEQALLKGLRVNRRLYISKELPSSGNYKKATKNNIDELLIKYREHAVMKIVEVLPSYGINPQVAINDNYLNIKFREYLIGFENDLEVSMEMPLETDMRFILVKMNILGLEFPIDIVESLLSRIERELPGLYVEIDRDANKINLSTSQVTKKKTTGIEPVAWALFGLLYNAESLIRMVHGERICSDI